MGSLTNLRIGFGTPSRQPSDSKTTIAMGTAKDQGATMATVLMTRFYDKKAATKYHRLLLMAEDDKVASTYPLNHKITRVGRSRRNHVTVEDPLVSITHLTVSVSGSTCVVNDLDSSNGTFVNGERVTGSRVLKHGDEVMLGKTILRFAAREETAPLQKERKAHQLPFGLLYTKKSFLLAGAMLCLMTLATVVYQGSRPAQGPLLVGKTQDSAQKTVDQGVAPSQPAVKAETDRDEPHRQARLQQTSHIQRALADYAAGRLNNAMQTLNMLAIAREDTPEALQAKRLLSMFSTVRDLHDQALQAQAQNKFAKAIECWDRLLVVDVELIGDRPSFFSAQAEEKVQTLSYAFALDAYKDNNHKKAKQLCHVILRLNPRNPEALALLARIDKKA